MGELVVAVSDVDDGLNERLDDEIYAFNAAATGLDDGRLLRVAVRGSGGELLAGLCGWTWGGCGYIELLWVRGDQRGKGIRVTRGNHRHPYQHRADECERPVGTDATVLQDLEDSFARPRTSQRIRGIGKAVFVQGATHHY